MIVPMKKVSLILLEDTKKETLKTLRKIGLLHIEIAEGSGEHLASLRDNISLLEKSIFMLKEQTKKKKQEKILPESKEIDTKKALSVAKDIDDLIEQKKIYKAQALTISAELSRLKDWGEVDPNEIRALTKKGITITLYDLPRDLYEELDESIDVFVLHKTKTSVKCLVIGAAALPPSFNPYLVALPQLSTQDMRRKAMHLERLSDEIDQKIVSYDVFSESLQKAVSALQKDIEFEVLATGMTDERLSDTQAVSVAYFKGYIEEENLETLKDEARKHSWGLLVENPTEEDDVPTKLKNNKFVSLIYPLTDFLGTVPGYFEYDISGWFLSFILIFFGIIFGDGGYGFLITAVAAILIGKSVIAKKNIPPAFLLFGLFGLSTILWGTLTCTWFGLAPEGLPMWLQKLSVPVISNVYADKIWYPFWTNGKVGLTTAQNLQIFCFSLALIQLTVAHIKGTLRNRKSLKALGDIGSILQLVGIYYVVLSLVVNAAVFPFGLVIGGFPIGTVAIALVGIGFVMSFVFSNYEGSVIKSLLTSLTNIVSVLLGVVNVFSDIVSYIRLWAVGLAGAAISATVNELAGPLFGNFLFMILAIFLLVFGHGLNMILNVLSVIVHGIRLNTLEFSSHLDMSWSGHKFKPFEE